MRAVAFLHCAFVATTSFTVFPSLHLRDRQVKSALSKLAFELASGGSSSVSAFNRNISQLTGGAGRNFHVDPMLVTTLRDSVNIVDVIESFGLNRFERKPPNQATAICPFHNDKSPSFSIDGDRRIFKCFGCGVGGDVFSFVREYSKLNGESMSYPQSVRFVQRAWGASDTMNVVGDQAERPVENAMLTAKKERLWLANAAAAAFYAECLLQPSSGGVRFYARSRGLTPSVARELCLGYAPDSYFGRSRGAWGEGSLVQHLQTLGFSASEIVESGLGVHFKAVKAPRPLSRARKSDDGGTHDSSVDESSIMDRFRDRLIVPIFDGSGKHVIALGGRVLPKSTPAHTSFHSAKYLNSPETIVFQKKRTLFGEYQARSHFKHGNPCDLVLVEGYMDAIALWNVGVNEVVASMGTSLSREQLIAAAKIAQSVKARVVLCLDNDAAGIAAIERLCRCGILKEISEKSNVEICVADLPDGIKDPDEFIALRAKRDGQESVGNQFRKDIVYRAKDWVKWYVNRIIATYNPEAQRGQQGSFGDIFEVVAEHLATSLPSADRTRLAFEVAGTLSAILGSEVNSTDASNAVRSQLESDLIELSARIARAKNSVRLRSELALDGQSNVNVDKIVFALANGQGPSGADDIAPIRFNATREQSPLTSHSSAPAASRTRRLPLLRPRENTKQTKEPRKSTHAKRRTLVEPTISLTPHFSGFRFTNKNDAAWLSDNSVGRQSTSLVLGKPSKSRHRSHDKLVYFNSNDYHGVHYLSDEAANAGYERGSLRRDASVMEKGIGSLLTLDTTRQGTQAENELLRLLIRHHSVRSTLRNIMDVRSAVGTSIDVEWSCGTKSWLFDSLMNKDQLIPPSLRDPKEVYDFLAGLPDCPPHALLRGSSSKNSSSNRIDEDEELVHDKPVTSTRSDCESLDYLFLEPSETVGVQGGYDSRLDVEVQLQYCTLLQASATRKLHNLQGEMETVLEKLSIANSTNEHSAANSTEGNAGELQEEFHHLALQMRDGTQALQSLARTAKHMTLRQLHERNAARIDGRLSTTLQEELASKLDEHMSNIKELQFLPEVDRFQGENEVVEEGMEPVNRIETRW